MVPMSCKKRFRPSPTVDSAGADLDDAALRKELCKKKQVKAKTAFSNVLSYWPGRIVTGPAQSCSAVERL